MLIQWEDHIRWTQLNRESLSSNHLSSLNSLGFTVTNRNFTKQQEYFLCAMKTKIITLLLELLMTEFLSLGELSHNKYYYY